MRRYPTTRYEIALSLPSGQDFLVAYSCRVSRPGLRDAMQAHGEALVRAMALTDADIVSWSTTPRPSASFGPYGDGSRGVVRFTGRTQRDAELHGELQWIGNEYRRHD